MSTPAEANRTLCPHCGMRNPMGANFCMRCGAALNSEMEQAPADPAAPLRADAFAQDARELGAVTGVRPEQAVDPAQGAVVEEVEERDLDQLLHAPDHAAPSVQPAEPALDAVPFPDEQLLGGGQGYLESVAIAGDAPGPMSAPDHAPARPASADNEHWRMLRSLLRDEPILATAALARPNHPNYRPLWITLLLLGAALATYFLAPRMATWGSVRSGPGVAGAFDALATLQVDDEVIVYWQADPATTGELNVVALPVISHLLERGARSIVISGQPVGLAAARRLYSEATQGMDNSVMVTVLQGWQGSGLFLSGGASALPLVARDAASLLSFAPTTPPAPQLALLVAPDAEDVQRWLEVVQPVNGVRVVAVTAAAAEPVLQPYLASGQLSGLVAGFDGAAAYQARRSVGLGALGARKQMLAVGVQNGGALALLLIVAAGNLARLFRRDRRG